jgi:DNA-binding transcriptional LysR family regulator
MHTWDIKQLEHFKAIYELKSISGAASHFGLTQSALTKSLKKLEERLDLPLFHRHTRELEPTNAAQALYPTLLEVLASAEDFSSRANQIKQGMQGHVNMACGPLIEQIIGPLLLKHLSESLSELKLRIRSGDFKTLSYGLINHEFDFLLYDSGNLKDLNEPERFEITPLARMPLCFFAAPNHPVFSENMNPFECNWALPSIPVRFKNILPDAIYGQFLKAGIPQYQLENMGLCIDLALEGHVISAAPEAMIHTYLKQNKLKQLNIPFTVESQFALYTLRSRKLSNSAQVMLQQIKALLKPL